MYRPTKTSVMTLNREFPKAELLLAIAYLVTSYMAVWIAREGSGFSSFWPPNAIMLGCLIRLSNLNVPMTFALCALAAMTGNLLLGDGMTVSATLMLVNMIEVGVSYYLIRRVFRSGIDFASIAHWIGIMLLTAFVGTGITATFGAMVTQEMFQSSFWVILPVWWLSDSVGMFLFLPAVLSFQLFNSEPLTRLRALETAGLLLVFLTLYELRVTFLADLSIIFFIPLIVWIAFRFGIFATSIFNISLSTEDLATLLAPVTTSISSELSTEQIMGVRLGLVFMSCTTLALAISTQSNRESEKRLQASNTRLAQLNSEMHNLLHIVSHDLKSPLVTVQGFVGLLRHHLKTDAKDAMLNDIERVESGTRVMSELIEDTLEFSTTDRTKAQPQWFNFDPLFQDVAEVLEGQLKQKEVTLTLSTPAATLKADEVKVRQAVLNLVENALKYGCPEPGMTIDVNARQEDNEARITVSDNGPGIDPRYHERIFKLFSRVDNDSEGTGAGLAIVAKVANQHDGEAGVNSAPSKGAEFWLTLNS